MLSFIKGILQSARRPRDRVSFDDEGVTRTLPDGRVEAARWEDLRRVEIVTTSDGPFVDDVYWLLAMGSTDDARYPVWTREGFSNAGELASTDG